MTLSWPVIAKHAGDRKAKKRQFQLVESTIYTAKNYIKAR